MQQRSRGQKPGPSSDFGHGRSPASARSTVSSRPFGKSASRGKGHTSGSTSSHSSDYHSSTVSYSPRGSSVAPSRATSSPSYSYAPSRGGSSYGSASSGSRSSYSSRPATYSDRPSYGNSSSYGGRSAYGSRPVFGGAAGSRFGGRPTYGSRPSFGGSRGGRSSFANQKIDVSRYINKSAAPAAPTAPFKPEHKFADFAVDDRVKNNVINKGYILPTPIQDKSIPVILEGSDIVGIANTGTGKTAAFLIPLIHKVLQDPTKEQVLVVAPTRELALQIEGELKEFAKGSGLYAVCAVGGAPIGKQLRELKYFNNFIIGTPGRIKDLIERRALDLSGFKTVVLDEADRMLDMGFIADMRLMMSKMSATRQTLFFSATLSPEIEKLIKDFLKNPVRISVKTQDTAKNIEQDVIHIKDKSTKIDVLHDLLTKEEFGKVLVFGKTKHGVEKLSEILSKKGIKAVSIHGNKNQGQRNRALDDFKQNRAKVLVATDVAARGLDIADITHVINYDIPSTHEDYIHRIGRTGRGDKKGKALTFVD